MAHIHKNVYNSGVPQGSTLGPLLFCANDLPMCLTGPSVQRDLFADDGTLNTANNTIDNILRDLQHSLNDISGWRGRIRMALTPSKTKCTLMATRQKHQKQQLPLNLKFETTPIEQVSKHHLLRVTVDEQLKWQTHINNICRTVSRKKKERKKGGKILLDVIFFYSIYIYINRGIFTLLLLFFISVK